MAEEIKTTPAPEGQTLEPPAPEVSEAPPAPEPGAQGVIPGMEGPPAPENKVINLSSVRAGQEQTDPAKEGGQEWEKPQEQPEPPRRGRRPKNKEAPAQGERPKRKGRPPKAEKQPPGGGGAGKTAKTATRGKTAGKSAPAKEPPHPGQGGDPAASRARAGGAAPAQGRLPRGKRGDRLSGPRPAPPVPGSPVRRPGRQ
jgi:hypothetical protein